MHGHYLWFVKENQPTLLDDIKAAFAPSVEGAFSPSTAANLGKAQDTATTLDKGHGRVERRTLKATTALNEYLDWPGVAQVGQFESVVEQDGKISHETRYFITSVRGSWPMQVSCSHGHEATGRSRIGPITCATSRSGRTRAGSARVPVPRSWPPSEMRRSASSGPPARRISPRQSVATLPKSENSSPNWVSSKSEGPCQVRTCGP